MYKQDLLVLSPWNGGDRVERSAQKMCSNDRDGVRRSDLEEQEERGRSTDSPLDSLEGVV